MDPRPILPSATDLERRRLESTVDQDLHSLSLASLITTSPSASAVTSQSFSSISSVEYPRGLPTDGPHGTPRAAPRTLSVGTGESPVSTAGHHVSAMTLADGVFGQKGERGRDGYEEEWDPERSLGRLVGELGRVMSGRMSPRPTSPFSPPRSPSPFPTGTNLSFTLNRNDPLPSPPVSRSGSRSSGDHTVTAPKLARAAKNESSRFTAMARELGNELKSRRVLGESTSHNVRAHNQTPAARRTKPRVKALQDEGRRSSAPGRVEQSADITGLTGLMETPAKGGEFGGLGKNGDAGGDAGGTIPATLATLHARLTALETENSLCRRRVRELEGELESARGEVEEARKEGEGRLREVVGEKTALEDLVKSLRSHLARLTIELEQNKALVSELCMAQQPDSPARAKDAGIAVHVEVADLRREVERLDKEVRRLGGVVEEGLETRRKARGERTVRMESEEAARMVSDVERERGEEMERARRDVERRQAATAPSKLRQGLHTVATTQPQLMPPTVEPRSRTAPPRTRSEASDDGHDSPTPISRGSSSHRRPTQREEGPASPFPSIRAEDEGEFFAALAENAPQRPSPCSKRCTTAPPPHPQRLSKSKSRSRSPPPLVDIGEKAMPPQPPKSTSKSRSSAPPVDNGEQAMAIPAQTVLARVLRELEDDFAHYNAIYGELADAYKALDAASARGKRRVLAQHLREVIDTLEQKAEQIAALYGLLTFQDKPDHGGRSGEHGGNEEGKGVGVKWSVGDVLRMVRDSLGEEGVRRLEEDGVGRRLHRVV